MQQTRGSLLLSPTDLSRSLACGHLTGLSLAVARGERKDPPYREDPLLQALIERGRVHEKEYVEHLKSGGADVLDLDGQPGDTAAALTLEAMKARREVIVQGGLALGQWQGRPDVLRRVERPGSWDWSYEAIDTKLARETAAGTILQLGLYSDLLREIQGVEPEFFHVVSPATGFAGEKHRVSDYAAYVRLMKGRLIRVCARASEEILQEEYPEPVSHCEVCAWSPQCEGRRRADDHLSLVAGISRQQREELTAHGISTLTGLATAAEIGFKPKRGSKDALERVREQAKAQHESKGLAKPVFRLREGGSTGPHEKDGVLAGAQGLARLPAPSAGDVFLDLEGDPFAVEGGREYLFGAVAVEEGKPVYHPWWAFTGAEEKVAFEGVIDFIGERVRKDPGAHVYHYGHYEPSALKRLMGRHATRGLELDALLRGERFVDLLGVVRQGIVAGVQSYSIKKLEPLYDFKRAVDLPDAREALTVMELALEGGLGAEDVSDDARGVVAGYNRDDCVSTLWLRDWLETVREGAIRSGLDLPRPEAPAPKDESKATEKRQQIAALRERLLVDVPSDRTDRDDEQQARWILAYLIDWHDREQKAAWWEYFRLRDLPDEDLFDERQAIVGMTFKSRLKVVTHKTTGRPTGTVVDRYTYVPQEMEIRAGDELHARLEEGFGTVVDVDRARRTIDISKGPKAADVHPNSVFEHSVVRADALEKSLFSLGEAIAAEQGFKAPARSPHILARRLLLAAPPVFTGGASLSGQPGETQTDLAVRLVSSLDESVLAVQGPPGSGKTYGGALMIETLVRTGKRVGVVATGHQVIRNLLDAIASRAPGLKLGRRQGEADESDGAAIEVFEGSGSKANKKALDALAAGAVQVLGGTAWLWSDPNAAGAVDVLFVDEASQMSLANVVAACRAARSLVLLGDPQQLEQPEKGSHPDGVGVSALGRILGDHKTIPEGLGLFLETTWRMAPTITSYTSEMFYERRLHAREGLDRQRLDGVHGLEGAGLFLVEVMHDANRSASDEEVAVIKRLVVTLTGTGATKTSCEEGQPATRAVTKDDILIVAPYNAQVSRLREALPDLAGSIGTVDKFQGRERAIVIYSMATSRPEDAPRGMEFLYSLNRFNVATSRARCAAIVVASPHLFEPECQSPRQIKLANALCRFRELARRVSCP